MLARQVVTALFLAMAAQAQPQPAARPEFEVVSIKPGDPADPSSSTYSKPGSLEMNNTTLNNLVRSAYNLNEYQLEGGPKWADSAKFNIVAKLPAGAQRDQVARMMQAMLADRFKLEFHRITKKLPEYQLVVAKGGANPEPANEEEIATGGGSQGPRQIKGRGMSITTLASMLINAVGAPVIDRTGLQGKYTFSLEFAPLSGIPQDNEPLPTIFTVLQKQLGLQLEPIKGPLEVLVIDQAQMPTAN